MQLPQWITEQAAEYQQQIEQPLADAVHDWFTDQSIARFHIKED